MLVKSKVFLRDKSGRCRYPAISVCCSRWMTGESVPMLASSQVVPHEDSVPSFRQEAKAKTRKKRESREQHPKTSTSTFTQDDANSMLN